MTKIFEAELESCMCCPYYEDHDFTHWGGGSQDWCKLSKKEIHPMDKIPSWCELPDKQ
jgi:hypothetical protein